MAFTEYTKDTTIVGALGTNPAERALTTQEFKDKFDQFAEEFVTWFNATHLPEVDAVQQEVDEHLAETVSQSVWIVRDISVMGTQTVSGFTEKPKRLDVIAVVANSKKWSSGNLSGSNQYAMSQLGDANMNGNAYSIVIGETSTNYTTGSIVINADNTLTITWAKIGTGGIGSAAINIIAHYH